MKVAIIGAGKVGRSLARALRATSHGVELRAARRGLPRERIAAALLVLAVRDGEVATWARQLASSRLVTRRTAVVHVAGALGPEVLDPLRGLSAGVAQAHPAVSFPSSSSAPSLRLASLLVAGDPVAMRRVAVVARSMGMVPRDGSAVDPVGYHVGCAIGANGAAAIGAAAVRLIVEAGVPVDVAPAVVGELLRSVGENISRLGVPAALSGPVRRGDVAALRAHLARLRGQDPDLLPLYLELGRVQLSMARELAEVPAAELRQVQAVLRRRR